MPAPRLGPAAGGGVEEPCASADPNDSRLWQPGGRPSPRRIALLFPGEYTAYPGMLERCRGDDKVKDMLAIASVCFGFDVEALMRDGPKEQMASTYYSQLLVLVADCVAFEMLQKERPEVVNHACCVSGFGVGEYAALVAAGVMEYEQALVAVMVRAQETCKLSEENDFKALGVHGLDLDHVQRLCLDAIRADAEQGAEDPQLHVSHVWGRPTGLVCTGRGSTVLQLHNLLESVHEAVTHLLEHTRDPLHTPQAEPVAWELQQVLQSIPMNPPTRDVYLQSGVHMDPTESPDEIVECLVRNVTLPHRWDAVVHGCISLGVEQFYECGPGHSLRDLMRYNVYEDVRRVLKPHEFTVCVKL